MRERISSKGAAWMEFPPSVGGVASVVGVVDVVVVVVTDVVNVDKVEVSVRVVGEVT